MGKNTIASRQSKIQYLDLKCKRYTQYLGGYRLLFVNYMEYIAHKSERYTTLSATQKLRTFRTQTRQSKINFADFVIVW